MTRTRTPILVTATTDPLRIVAHRQFPWDGLLAQWLSLTLDTQLAAGAAADAHKLRQVRARQLSSPRRRAKLAARWDELLEHCTGLASNRLRAAGVPVQQRQIRAAASEIRDLAGLLRAGRPVSARGVAMASLLLTDGAGPVYNPASAGRLRRSLQAAIQYLEPAALLPIS